MSRARACPGSPRDARSNWSTGDGCSSCDGSAAELDEEREADDVAASTRSARFVEAAITCAEDEALEAIRAASLTLEERQQAVEYVAREVVQLRARARHRCATRMLAGGCAPCRELGGISRNVAI